MNRFLKIGGVVGGIVVLAGLLCLLIKAQPTLQRVAVSIGAVVFIAFLGWKLRPKLGPYRAQVADRKGKKPRRWRRQPDWERAILSAPTDPQPIAQAVAMVSRPLHRRRLERRLWERLETLPWTGAHLPVVIAAASALAQMYDPKRRARAVTMRKLCDLLEKENATRRGTESSDPTDSGRL